MCGGFCCYDTSIKQLLFIMYMLIKHKAEACLIVYV